MATGKKPQKLTQAQKKMNAEIKKDMQNKGILPSDKKPLNRKRFAIETLESMEDEGFNFFDALPQIMDAFSVMIPHMYDGKIIRPVTAEQVGALKVLRIAMEIKRFWDRKRSEGKTQTTVKDIYDEAIAPILEL